MTAVHACIVGETTVLPRSQFERLVALARRSDHVEVRLRTDEAPAAGIMRLADTAGAFDWLADEEDLYSVDDLRVRY